LNSMIQTMTIKEAMTASSLPRLEVRMLLEAVLNQPRTWLIAHDDEILTEQQAQMFYIMVARRTAGVPMAYLLGTREFMGLTFCVSPHVLIPRPDTETLVNKAIEVIRENDKLNDSTESQVAVPIQVLDMGTGSGAIAISIAKACPNVQIDATDFSAEALGIARLNAECLGVKVNWFLGDWYHALANQASSVHKAKGMTEDKLIDQAEHVVNGLHLEVNKRYDLIVSNPPYIQCDDEHLAQGDLRFEPPQALTDGADGLTALKKIIEQAPIWLKPGGQVWVEHGYNQAVQVQGMLEKAGFTGIQSLYDLGEKPRVSGGYLSVSL
jgi:release factor glutamine methyltransferase